MKKTINTLFLGATLLISTIASGQYLPLKDFQDQSITSGGWSSYVVTSTPGSYDWETSDQGSTGDFYAVASGFNGSGADDTELWLISPSFDLTSATSPVLTFKSAVDFNGPDIEIFISTDYDGTSDPSLQGTWDDITSQATLSPGSFNWTNSGDVDLSSYNGNSGVYVAYKYTSTTSAGAAKWEIDNIKVDEPTAAVNTPIYDIQFTTNASGESDFENQEITTSGIVCAVRPGGGNNNPAGFYIQDEDGPWSGVFVEDENITVAEGDSIELTGTVNELFDQTQIENVTAHTIHGSGYPVLVTQISTSEVSDEEYEGVLVQVITATCTNPNAGFGQFEINDNSGTCLVDDEIYSYPNPQLNTVYDVTGPIRYSFSEFKIEPRRASDVEVSPFNSIEEDQNTQTIVYPNPSMGSVVIENKGQFNYTITDLSGKVLESGSGNDAVALETEKIGAGIYFIQVEKQNSSEVIRWVKK